MLWGRALRSLPCCVCVVSCEPNGEAHLQQISIVGCSQSIEMWLVL